MMDWALRRFLPLLLCALCLAACKAATPAKQPPVPEQPKPAVAEQKEAFEKQEQLDAEFPLHGLVTGLQLKVHKAPDPEAIIVGWLRIGSRIRLAPDVHKTPTCASGFYSIAGGGYACAGEGIEVGSKPPDSQVAVVPPARDAGLPYKYYYVKDDTTPEYHRLPSRDEQRAVETFVARYLELKAKDEKKAQRFMAGELAGEPHKPEYVRRFMARGFFVAGTGVEIRAFRRFVRTVRGSYVKQIQLDERKENPFHGVLLDDQHKLPLAWAVRAGQSFVPRVRADDGVLRMLTDEGSKNIERLSLLPWVKREHVGDQLFHKLDDGHYLKAWYVAVAEAIPRPKEIRAGEPWVHVNLEQQTLVAYLGDTPVYATLVSSGVPGHDTPVGLFDIRTKYVSATMSDLGPEVSEDLRYSIEDVPWTQYFSGSVALHGAFWHGGFGLQHSHGCVNLAPLDARWLFDHTWPELPEGWHGVTTDGGRKGTKVWITEK